MTSTEVPQKTTKLLAITILFNGSAQLLGDKGAFDREISAATRSLLNTVRLMDDNPTLLQQDERHGEVAVLIHTPVAKCAFDQTRSACV
jgi:hypothetical protein